MLRDTFPGYVVLIDPKDEHAAPPDGVRYFADPNADLSVDAPAWGLVDRRCAEAFRRGSCLVICDEMDLAVGRGQQGPVSPVRVVMHGRHRDVSYAWACRRPAELPRSYTSQATEFCVYRLTEPADLEYCHKRGVPREWPPALAVGEFVHLVDGSPPHTHHSALEPCQHRRK